MDHAEDRSLEVRAVAAAFMTVAVVTVMLRCYVRARLVKAFGWDDTSMVVALVGLFLALTYETEYIVADGKTHPNSYST
jgi:hypothetical protein